MVTQVILASLIFGSIIEGQYSGTWYKVRILRKTKTGASIEWLEGEFAGREDYKSVSNINDTNQFRKWKQY